MGISKNIEPHETYEGLKRQFFALKKILQSKEAELHVYQKRIREFDFEKIIELEAELESQKEMNSILTEELESSQREDFSTNISKLKVVRKSDGESFYVRKYIFDGSQHSIWIDDWYGRHVIGQDCDWEK